MQGTPLSGISGNFVLWNQESVFFIIIQDIYYSNYKELIEENVITIF